MGHDVDIASPGAGFPAGTLANDREALYSKQVNLLHDLPLYDRDGRAHVVIEVPQGSNVKLKYDDELGVFTWSRALSLGVCFPHDFGFLPQTLAEDGDAVDSLVLSSQASYPGVVVKGRVLGALRVEQKRPGQPVKRNDRVLLVPANAQRCTHLHDVDDVARRTLEEIQAFFQASLLLTGKSVRFCGWANANEARTLIDEAHERYLQCDP